VKAFASTSSGFAQKCVDGAAGKPLFEQLMRAADEQSDRLPASLHSLVLSRMAAARSRSHGAACGGRCRSALFAQLVRRMAQLPDYECDNLVAHFLVRPKVTSSCSHMC
jgi:hypothetical protein